MLKIGDLVHWGYLLTGTIVSLTDCSITIGYPGDYPECYSILVHGQHQIRPVHQSNLELGINPHG